MKGGEKMKKLFLILAILCLGAVMPMISAAQTQQTQPVSVTVAEETKLTIAPASLDFGSARPLIPKEGQNVTFDSTGSNVDVSVGSSVEQGSIFENINFLLSGGVLKNIKEFSISLPISSPIGTVGTQISVPTGIIPGLRTGIITYTITSTFCGDNAKNGYETCDGTDLNGETCETQGFDGGTLTCKSDCNGFDTSLCTTTPECTPECTGKTCGDDGCGGTCGTCDTETQTCNINGVCENII